MFGHGDGAVVGEVGVTSTLKAKAIFDASFSFNKSFWGVLKVPSVNIHGVGVLRLRRCLSGHSRGIVSRSRFRCQA